jgi:hypothetical protein
VFQDYLDNLSESERARWRSALEDALEGEGTEAERYKCAMIIQAWFLPGAVPHGEVLQARPEIAARLKSVSSAAHKEVRALEALRSRSEDARELHESAQSVLRSEDPSVEPPELEAIARYLEILASLAERLIERAPKRRRRSLDLRAVTVAKAIAAAYWQVFHRPPPKGRRGANPRAFTRARRIKRDNAFHRLCGVVEQLLKSSGRPRFAMSDRARAAGIRLMSEVLINNSEHSPFLR